MTAVHSSSYSVKGKVWVRFVWQGEIEMTESQRIDYLIKRLEGDNARTFAEKCGIPAASISRARNGKQGASYYFRKILAAYPSVSPDWLIYGKGDPLTSDNEQSEVIARIKALEKEVRRLARLIENLEKSR